MLISVDSFTITFEWKKCQLIKTPKQRGRRESNKQRLALASRSKQEEGAANEVTVKRKTKAITATTNSNAPLFKMSMGNLRLKTRTGRNSVEDILIISPCAVYYRVSCTEFGGGRETYRQQIGWVLGTTFS